MARAKRKQGKKNSRSDPRRPGGPPAPQSVAGSLAGVTRDSANESSSREQVTADGWPEPTSKEKLQMLGCLLLVIAAIFAVTSMEAPFYMDYERAAGDPIHRDDSHIGAPWRYFGVSVLWFISVGALTASTLSWAYAQRKPSG